MSSNIHKRKVGRGRKENQRIILESAAEEFARFGFEGASIANIAKRANIPRPNLHYYFSSKLELYQQILFNILKLWNSAFDNVSVEDDPATAISNYIRAKVMFSKTNPKASKIFATEIIQGGTNLTDFLQDDYKVWLRDKTSIIRKWSDNGQMDAVEPHHLIFMIWSSTQFYADFSIQVENGLEKEADDQEFEKQEPKCDLEVKTDVDFSIDDIIAWGEKHFSYTPEKEEFKNGETLKDQKKTLNKTQH